MGSNVVQSCIIGGGVTQKKPYPRLTFCRVGVGFYLFFRGFLGLKKLIFADFSSHTQCENMHILQHKCTNDEVNIRKYRKQITGWPRKHLTP